MKILQQNEAKDLRGDPLGKSKQASGLSNQLNNECALKYFIGKDDVKLMCQNRNKKFFTFRLQDPIFVIFAATRQQSENL